MPNVRILKKPTEDRLWALKVGGVYEMTSDQAGPLIESGHAEIIETAMAPVPGNSKRVRKSNICDKRTDQPGRSKGSPPRHE